MTKARTSADVRFAQAQYDELNRLVEEGYYHSRAEAIREAVRLLVRHHPEAAGDPMHPRVRDGGEESGE